MTTQEQRLPAKTQQQSSLLVTGLALFSMFFGAGNLIFPLLIGQSVGANSWFAILGLSLTAVIVPFLGLTAMVLFQGDYHRFFGRTGKIPGVILLLLLQLILGPLGVIPRLITLMHAMAKPYLFDMPLLPFSIFSTLLIFCCSFKKQKLIGFLGTVLTPILLLSLAALIIIGLNNGSSLNPVYSSERDSFFLGLLGGYNTMDLIAAFLFATVVLPHFQKQTLIEHPAQRQRALLKKMFLSSLIAASLLLLSYVALCWISSYHSWTLDANYQPEELLGAIAFKLLGPTGSGIAAITVIVACLTTAITLASIFADYLQKDLCKEKINPATALILTLITAMFFSNLGFSGIAAFLGPILQICYPGLIVLTVLNIAFRVRGFKPLKVPVFLTFICSAILYIIRF